MKKYLFSGNDLGVQCRTALYSVYHKAVKLKLKVVKAVEEVLKRFMQSRGYIFSFGLDGEQMERQQSREI